MTPAGRDVHRFALRVVALALVVTGPCLWRPAGGDEPCPRGVLPAYAHNDYANPQPLTGALRLGFRGVEADVFLVDGVLRVGHDRRRARTGPSLETLYLEPLRAVVDRCGALTADGRRFLLTVEIKERSLPTYDALVALMARYGDLVAGADSTGRGPPVEVVLVGWHPPPASMRGADTAFGLQYRLTRAEPGLPDLDPRVRLLSLDYGKTLGRRRVTPAGRQRWLATLRSAKAAAPGRLLRVHNLPADRLLYGELLDAGVDLIGTERPTETARLLAAPAAP